MRKKYRSGNLKMRFCSNQYSTRGDRRYQEDQLFKFEDARTIISFGVFDGHGGKHAALFAKEHLLNKIQEQEGYLSKEPEEMIQAIKNGFAATQAAMLEVVDSWPKTGSGHRSTAGTTVSLVIVDLRRCRMYVAHVGDSRIVLGRKSATTGNKKWQTFPLTSDHKPECAKEKKRIEDDGGAIVAKYNVSRVVWNRSTPEGQIDPVPFLSIARSLGDLWSYNQTSGKYIVSPVPDVSCHDMTTDITCLVLGSDGLFNMLANEETVSHVQEVDEFNECALNRQRLGRRFASSELVARALDKWRTKGLRSDNISVLTVSIQVTDLSLIEEEPKSSSEDDEQKNSTSERRPPLNHLNQNRSCGTKRSRSLDSSSPKRQKRHTMDLRGCRDRACKRSSSTTAK